MVVGGIIFIQAHTNTEFDGVEILIHALELVMALSPL